MIERRHPPISVKGVRSFLRHACFYWRFIKDFSKISPPLCNMVDKECKFYFYEYCFKAFSEVKEKLVSAPIKFSPDWSKPFEVMYDASWVELGMVLEQRRDNILIPFTLQGKPLMKPKRTTL